MTKKQIATAIVAGLMAMGAGAMVTSFTQPEPEQAAQVQQVAQVETKAQVVEQKPQKVVEQNANEEQITKELAELFAVQEVVDKLEPGMTSQEAGAVVRSVKTFIKQSKEDGRGSCLLQFTNRQVTLSFSNSGLCLVSSPDTAYELAEMAAYDPEYNVTPNKAARITKNMPRGTVNQILGRKGITAFKAMNSAWYEDHQVWYTTNGDAIKIIFRNNRVHSVNKIKEHYSKDVATAHNGI